MYYFYQLMQNLIKEQIFEVRVRPEILQKSEMNDVEKEQTLES